MLKEMVYGLAALATALTRSSARGACNTMTGVGKGVESSGQKIQDESLDLQHQI